MNMLTLAEVADRLGTTERHVRRLLADHALPAYKVGGLIRVDAGELAAWLAEQRRAVTA